MNENIRVAAVLIFVSACGASGPPTEVASEGEADVRGVTLSLLEAGEEPRQRLRYSHVAGYVEDVVLTMGMQVTATDGDRRVAVAGPPVGMLVRFGPLERREERSLVPLAIQMAEIAVPEGTDESDAAALRAEIEPLTRMHGTFTSDPLGRTIAANVPIPAGVELRTAQMLGTIRANLMTVPLPEEPVGVGARWEARRTTHGAVQNIEQVTTYTLREINADGPVLQVSYRATAPVQAMQHPTSPEIEMSLVAYESTGVGTARVDLHAITAISEIDFTNLTRAEFSRGAQEAEIHSEIRMRVTVTPDL